MKMTSFSPLPINDARSTTVLHELDGSGVLTLTLNRPERHNVWKP